MKRPDGLSLVGNIGLDFKGKGLRPGASYGRIDKYEVQLIRRRLSDEEDNGQCILCRCE